MLDPESSPSGSLAKTLVLLSAATLLAAGAHAQGPETPARPAASGTTPPITRADPNSPANAGRKAVSESLNELAFKYTAQRHATVDAIKTLAAAKARQAKVRARILSLIGSLPERTPLNAQVTGTTQLDGFRIEKILFESQPGFRVTALFYIPDGKEGTKLPTILLAPGHGATGKAADYATAATFARNGFAVLSYDPIGQGERLQYPDPKHPGQSKASRPTGEHGEAGLQPVLIGETIDKYFIWDAIRAVDYLLTRPEVDPTRIGAMGCSGGGTITALTAALEPRIAVAGVACYTTSFDELLATSSVGPQDAEQSIPGFIAPGAQNLPLDFPDWIELVAPRPYAVIATYNDMFPFAGARTTVIEARRFYSLFDPSVLGASNGGDGTAIPNTPSEPALNPDTTNTIPPSAPLQFITGPGGHGNLGPIMDKIVSFYMIHLMPGVDPTHPKVPPVRPRGQEASAESPTAGLPKDALQVTPTGQVSSSYPNSETVFSLNLKHAAGVVPKRLPVLTGASLAAAVRKVTASEAEPNMSRGLVSNIVGPTVAGYRVEHLIMGSAPGIDLKAEIAYPNLRPVAGESGRHPAILLLIPEPLDANTPTAKAAQQQFNSLAAKGNVVLAVNPRPSPPGTEEIKSPILGDMYLTTLRAMLVGKTILGLRVDDTIRAVDYLVTRKDVDPTQLTAMASGHMGLVLLHAAILDPRLKHITIDHTLGSYRGLLEAPLPLDAPVDILPGVLLHYDIPDLTKALGPRLTFNDPLQGTDNLAYSPQPK